MFLGSFKVFQDWYLARGQFREEKRLLFLILSKVPPPPETQFWTKNTIYTIYYTIYIQPKKQYKVQIIGILEEIDYFYWPKMHLCKGGKNLGKALPPSFGQNPKEQQLFFCETIP